MMTEEASHLCCSLYLAGLPDGKYDSGEKALVWPFFSVFIAFFSTKFIEILASLSRMICSSVLPAYSAN